MYTKILLLVIFFNSFVYANLNLTDEEKNYIHNHSTITVTNDKYWIPFDYQENGNPTGYSIDLLSIIEKKLHITFKYIHANNWNDLVVQFKNGEIDLCQSFYKSNKRLEYALFSKPYHNNISAVFQRKGLNLTRIDDLAGKKVVIPRGFSSLEIFKNKIKNLKIIEVETADEALYALAIGKADFFIESAITIQQIITEKGIPNITLAFFPNLEDEQFNNFALHFATLKNNPILLSIIQKGYDSISIDERKKLHEKWFGSLYENNTKKKWLEEIPKNTFRQDLTTKERLFLEKKESLKLCINKNWMPYEETKNGVYSGISQKIMEKISQEIELPITTFASSHSSDKMELLKKNKCDIIPLSMNNNSNSLNFTNPYIIQPLVIVTNNNEMYISNIKELQNKRFAILKNRTLKNMIISKYPNLELVDVDSPLDGLYQVENNAVFGYIGTPPSITYNIHKESLLDLKISGKLDLNVELSIASNPSEPLFQNILEKALNNISTNEMNEIVNSWYRVKYETTVDYTLVWKILFGTMLIIIVFSYWMRKMSIANNEKEVLLEELKLTQIKLQQLAITDKLTSLYNRNKIDDALDLEFHRSIRYKIPLGVILLDIDHFKKVNDTYGHQIGDKILIEIANIIKSHSREIDIVGRWGGEEFLIICPQTDLVGTLVVAEKIRKEIEGYAFVENIHKTASFGVSEYRKNDQIKDIVSRADKALYEVKNSGRNKVQSL